jgi:Zn-dependent protease with chaperone function
LVYRFLTFCGVKLERDRMRLRRKRMRRALRSAIAVLMLAVVCALAAVAVLGVAVALVVAVNAGGAWSILAGISVAGLLAALGVSLFGRRRRRKRGEGAGVRITTEEQPLFWVEIYRVAEGLDIDPPDELLLFPDADVTVSEGRTRMGLRPGVRRLHLGLPLLAGMTERELRAVIASESCRRWGPVSLARLIYRGRDIIGRVADRIGEKSIFGRIVGRFGRAYLAVSSPITRRHELEADRLSADISGNNATAAALREFAVLNKGWAAFVDGYAGPAAAVGRRPENLFAGFTSFLQDPGRRAQLAESADEPGSQQRSAYASQLSLEDRLAAIESLPEDDIHDRSGSALGLMRNPDQLIRQVEECMFRESDSVPATWEDILPEAGGAAAREDAMHLQRLGQEGGLGPTLSVAALLELLSLGLVDEMVRPMLPAGASTPRWRTRNRSQRSSCGCRRTAWTRSSSLERALRRAFERVSRACRPRLPTRLRTRFPAKIPTRMPVRRWCRATGPPRSSTPPAWWQLDPGVRVEAVAAARMGSDPLNTSYGQNHGRSAPARPSRSSVIRK